jgi:hypothetical protein
VPAELHDRVLRNRTAQLTALFQQKLGRQAVLLRAQVDERDRRSREALDSLNRAWEDRYACAASGRGPGADGRAADTTKRCGE